GVVKADGYGHGAAEVAIAAKEAGCSAFGVATAEEAFTLRMSGIKDKILILGTSCEDSIAQCIRRGITMTVCSYDEARLISEKAAIVRRKAEVHIKVDTGMRRLGFPPNEAGLEEAVLSVTLPGICLTGIFSHFATSDSPDKSYAFYQANLFERFCKEMRARGFYFRQHIANSAATISLPEFHYEYVRPGIILYGVTPSDTIELGQNFLPAMSVESNVVSIRKVRQNESVGYGQTFFAQEEKIIATIPAGYADGLPRILSNRGRVIINGEFAPIVGNICMDMFMADITRIPSVKIGDIVTIVGKNGGKSISMTELAALAETIPYETLCRIGNGLRSKREFFKVR
ncbi:MAG: alanine racemase, partial [Clostridiales bacterium]|nr:alanine racemase [Clostridiales bacterium]